MHARRTPSLSATIACLALATLFADGKLVPRDPARAARYYGSAVAIYDLACQAGNEPDCTERDRIRTRMLLHTGMGR